MPITVAWDRKHLLGLEALPREDLVALLDKAARFRPVARREAPPLTSLEGRIVANLFFEDSTRTRCSFTVAAKRLGADTIELTNLGSSRSKGESLVDTVLTIEAMGVDAIVIRDSASGAAALVAGHVHCGVINAGDGRHEHPTQGLLDILALRERIGDLAGKTVAIVGDVSNSRVARSAAHGLTALGADVLLVGPPTLAPAALTRLVVPESEGGTAVGAVRVAHDLDEILGEVDAIMMLRVQFERGSFIAGDYREHYGMTVERSGRLRAGVPILHPGPMNAGLEIDSAVAASPRSVILEQVTSGVAVRMAVLDTLLEA
jgi:aspartate carbamoyltransferase catalytic subunit